MGVATLYILFLIWVICQAYNRHVQAHETYNTQQTTTLMTRTTHATTPHTHAYSYKCLDTDGPGPATNGACVLAASDGGAKWSGWGQCLGGWVLWREGD
jgi:hypothetical protein